MRFVAGLTASKSFKYVFMTIFLTVIRHDTNTFVIRFLFVFARRLQLFGIKSEESHSVDRDVLEASGGLMRS